MNNQSTKSTKEELLTLVKDECITGGQRSANGLCFLERLMLDIDEKVNVKRVMRLWGPRLESVVRLMLVATFLDESFHTAMQFSQQTTNICEQGVFGRLYPSAPKFVVFMATLLLSTGILAQAFGSFCVLTVIHIDIATKALICWTIAQPVLYAQLSNLELMAASISLIGGLIMLQQAKGSAGTAPRTQLIGRLLLPTVYMYNVGKYLHSTFVTLDETNTYVSYFSSLSVVGIKIAMAFCLIIGCMLVAVGLKSRAIALLLAILNLGLVFYQHPFFLYLSIQNGKWTVDKDSTTSPSDIFPEADYDIDPWAVYQLNLDRYYFFLGLSTSGALLLLAQFGPGKIAIQNDETILPHVSNDFDCDVELS